jgi:putative endonuclease
MYYVYVLYSKDENKFYIGSTSDLKRRVEEHKAGKVHTTCRYKSITLLFYEAFYGKEDALRRECYFKTTKGRKSLRLILRDSLLC